MREIFRNELFTNSPVAEPQDGARLWRIPKGVEVGLIESMLIDKYMLRFHVQSVAGATVKEKDMHVLSEIGPEGHHMVFCAFDKPVLKDGVYRYGLTIEGHHLTQVDADEIIDNLAGRTP